MKRLTVIYEVPDDYNITRITGTGELNVVRCESMDVMQELGKVTARLAAAEAERAEERAAVKKAGIVFQRIGTDLVAINFPFNDATARLAAAEAAMKAAASLPGRLWLTGQLALAEFLSGEGGENLDYALEQYKAAKGGRDDA